jgi:hypothetical protein
MDFFSFVIVPDPDAESDGQFFHVAFPNKMNPLHNDPEHPDFPPPPLADVTFEAEEFPDLAVDGFEDEFSPSGDAGTFDNGGSSGGFTPSGDDSFSSGSGGGFDASAPAIAEGDTAFEAEAPETAGDDEAFDDVEDEVVAQAPVAAGDEGPGQGGFNIGYILLPLLGLGLATTLGYSLSQDPELPVEREGAVSKLMQRRPAQAALASSTDA